MTARRLLILLLLAACAPAAAAEKTLYKCRAADGSLAFQEEPCIAPLAVIPIAPESAAPFKLTDPTCIAMARDIWYLKGTVEHIDTSEPSRQRLREREDTLRNQCGATLDRTQLQIECAVLGGALGVRGDGTPETEASLLKVRQQHAAQCGDAQVEADMARHLRAAPPQG